MKKKYSILLVLLLVLVLIGILYASQELMNEEVNSFKIVNASSEWKVVKMSNEDAKDYFIWANDKTKQKTEICFLSYTAKKTADLKDLTLSKSTSVEAKTKTEANLKPTKVQASKSKLKQDYYGYCYTVDSEKYLKYGSNSTELTYDVEKKIQFDTKSFSIDIKTEKWNGKEYVLLSNVFINDFNFNRLKFGNIDKNPIGKELNKYKYIFESTQDFKFDDKKNLSYLDEDGERRYLYLNDICGVSYSQCKISSRTGKIIEVEFLALNKNGEVLIDPLFLSTTSIIYSKSSILAYNQTQIKNTTSGAMLLNNTATTFFTPGETRSLVFDNIFKISNGESPMCFGSPISSSCESLFYTAESCNASDNHQGQCSPWSTYNYCSGNIPEYCGTTYFDESSCNGDPNFLCYWSGACYAATECYNFYEQFSCESGSGYICSWSSYGSCPTNTGFTCAGQNTASNISEACDAVNTGCTYALVPQYNYTSESSAFTIFLNSSIPTNTSLKIATRNAENYLTHSNLVYHWSFNDGLNSRVGNSTSTNYGMEINESGVVGFGLESSDDYMTMTDPCLLDGLTGLSVSLWARTTSTGNENFITDAIDPYQRKFSLFNNVAYMAFYVSGDGGTLPKVGGPTSSPSKFNDGKWHHFVGTWQGSPARMELWKDGVMIDNTTESGTAIPSSLYSTAGYDLYLGGFPGIGGDLDGDVDEVMIFNKSLNSTEINLLYEHMFLNFTKWNPYEPVTNETNFRKNGTVITNFFQFRNSLATTNTSLTPSILSYEVNRTFNISQLPPTQPIIISPIAGYYNRNISINYSASTSPGNHSLTYYNISLLNSDYSFNQTIITNNSLNLNYAWTTDSILSSGYIIQVDAYDNQSRYSSGHSDIFYIDKINPNATLISPSNNTISNNQNQNFTVNLSDNMGIKNVSLWINGVLNETITFIEGITETTLGIVKTLTSGMYTWFYSVFDWAGNSYTTENNTLTLDVYPSVVFNYQYPSDLNLSNFIGSNAINISYNVTATGLNYSTIKMYYKTNSTSDNIHYCQNGTCISGYFADNYVDNTSSVFTWQLRDNQILPGIYNYGEITLENTPHVSATLSNLNQYLSIELLNVSNSSRYGFFEAMINRSSGSSALRFYYCNSSYNYVTNPAGNINCNLYYQLTNLTYNHQHTIYSAHIFAPFSVNETAGTIGNVKITQKSYFIVRGDGANTFNYYYISNTSRLGAYKTSNNGGLSWTNQTYTIDAHLHQYGTNQSLWYYVCANNTANNQNCSVARQDLFELAGLPPTSPSILVPTNITYSGIINITYSASLSPNSYSIIYYNISLLNSSYSFNKTIIQNNSLNLNYSWNTTGTLDGQYVISVEASDSLGQKSSSYSDIFFIDNSNPSATLTNPANNTYSNSSLQNFTVNLSDNLGIKNVSLWINGVLNQTVTYLEGVTQSTLGIVVVLTDGIYNWFYQIFDWASNQYITPNNTLTIDTIFPNYVLTSPLNGNYYTSLNQLFNLSTTSTPNASIIPNIDNSLVLWYRMDDVNSTGTGVVDYIGRNNGTAIGTASQVTNGKFGKAFGFESGRISFNSIQLVANYSISMWINLKADALGNINSNWYNLISDDGTEGIYLIPEGNKISFYNGTADCYMDENLSLNTWYFITMINNGTNNNLFLNSNLLKSCSNAITIDFNSIGGDSIAENFNGSIDDVIIFNRSLSSEEIKSLYNASSYETTKTLAEGNHTFIAYVQDLAGNINSTGLQTFNINIPIVEPPIAPPANPADEGWLGNDVYLYDIEIDYEKTWTYDSTNKIKVKTFNINNKSVDVDNINIIPSINNSKDVKTFNLLRINTGVYEQQFIALNSSMQNITFKIIAIQDSKNVTKSITINLVSKTPFEQFKENATEKIRNITSLLISHAKNNPIVFIAEIVVLFLICVILVFLFVLKKK